MGDDSVTHRPIVPDRRPPETAGPRAVPRPTAQPAPPRPTGDEGRGSDQVDETPAEPTSGVPRLLDG